MSNIWYFEQVNLFEILCPHKVKPFPKKHAFKEFNKNEFIYFEEESSTNIFLIAKGRVKVLNYTEEGDELVKAVLTRGEIFGELAILGEEKRTDFAQAIEDKTVVCPMHVDDLQDLMRENQTLSLRIYKLIGLRIKKLERQIRMLVFKDVRTRLLEFIREMMEERGQQSGDFVIIEHPYTQQDIAHLIGASRQTVSTLLNDLQKDRFLKMNRRQIVVFQPNYFKNSTPMYSSN